MPAARPTLDSPNLSRRRSAAAMASVLAFLLPRQAGGIFVDTFAEGSAHACGQAYAGFAEFVAQAVGGSHGVFPALLAVAFEEIDLIGLGGEGRGLHAEQADLRAFFPVLAEEDADLLEDFRVELRRGWRSV